MFRAGFVGRQVVGSGSGGGPPGLSLDLSFMTPGTLDPRITFTRASVGTYFDVAGVLQTATANTPRWDYDPVTHALRGLLIEEQRINSFQQSGDFTQAVWVKGSGATLGPGTPGPNGAVTGSGMISANATLSFLQQGMTSTAGTTVTLSSYVKAARDTVCMMLFAGPFWADAGTRFCSYTLTGNGTITGLTGSTASATITPVGNGWYRITLTATPDLSVSANVHAVRAGANGDGVAIQYYVFGAQLEVGAFATSYIPTTAAAVTRSADVASMPTAAWFNAAAGTLVASAIFNAPSSYSTNQYVAALRNVGSTDRLGMFRNNTDGILSSLLRVAGANVYLQGAASTSGAVMSAGVASVVGTQHGAVNGVSLTDGASALSPTPTALDFGNLGVSSYLNGYLQRVRYWPRALSNSELQQVTI